ncbi:conserved hypothetical protein [Neospora caninum Liverpool]|uniref:Uncharacterized protein n=1 Tax=Neospora caninum (strain Liverpool) TaxID=572307 RepID=F0V860_NEOCL|nr:conserved hypothetical protein [Neospora caninum Liverpool]CBZ49901.1 conserved hypothetical protein [Neospora caninum Liverpool]CEL64488.1 TPA: hypothetical protein BN1204_003860 [Neospora caninum Liverpool]|eukprot:XP_003879936.1 conserved hypothetical protein [Neospora caninum Liverpool]
MPFAPEDPAGCAWTKLQRMTDEMHRDHGWGPQHDAEAQRKLSELLAAAAVCTICSADVFPALTQLGVTLSCVRASYDATIEALQKGLRRPRPGICKTFDTVAFSAEPAGAAVRSEEASAATETQIVDRVVQTNSRLAQPRNQADSQNNRLPLASKRPALVDAHRRANEITPGHTKEKGVRVGSANLDGDSEAPRTFPSNAIGAAAASGCFPYPLEPRAERRPSKRNELRPDAVSAVLERTGKSGRAEDWSAPSQVVPAMHCTLSPRSEEMGNTQRSTAGTRAPLSSADCGNSEMHRGTCVDGRAENAVTAVEKQNCGFSPCEDNPRSCRRVTSCNVAAEPQVSVSSASREALPVREKFCLRAALPLRQMGLGESRSSAVWENDEDATSRCHIVSGRRTTSRHESKEGTAAVSLPISARSPQNNYHSQHISDSEERSSLHMPDRNRGCFEKQVRHSFHHATGKSPKTAAFGSSDDVPCSAPTGTMSGTCLGGARHASRWNLRMLVDGLA